jgi:hypothetical protein
MATLHRAQTPTQRFAGEDARARLPSGLPVTERRLQLAGVPTAVPEGARGDPAIEQPAAFLEALRTALGSGEGKS